MAVLLVTTYNVTDPEGFAEYNPGSLPFIGATIAKHGGSMAFGGAPKFIAGDPRHVAVGISFPDAESAEAWMNDAEYATVAHLREESTADTTVFMIETR